jgi:hypothetical protein
MESIIMFICHHCDSERKSIKSLRAHVATCRNNPTRSVSWNTGKTSKTDPILAALADKLTGRKRPDIAGEKNPFFGKKFGANLTGHTDETKNMLRDMAIKNKLGGYIQGSGRGKKGWYNGFFCDSSWELAYVVYCLEHGIDIKRNTEKRQYVWQGVVKNYIPDFIVQGTITEIKGFKTEQWLAKLEANPDVQVLYEKDLEPILEYVKNKYGKDFISLYE